MEGRPIRWASDEIVKKILLLYGELTGSKSAICLRTSKLMTTVVIIIIVIITTETNKQLLKRKNISPNHLKIIESYNQ